MGTTSTFRSLAARVSRRAIEHAKDRAEGTGVVLRDSEYISLVLVMGCIVMAMALLNYVRLQQVTAAEALETLIAVIGTLGGFCAYRRAMVALARFGEARDLFERWSALRELRTLAQFIQITRLGASIGARLQLAISRSLPKDHQALHSRLCHVALTPRMLAQRPRLAGAARAN
jgi:hypothetical protein